MASDGGLPNTGITVTVAECEAALDCVETVTVQLIGIRIWGRFRTFLDVCKLVMSKLVQVQINNNGGCSFSP